MSSPYLPDGISGYTICRLEGCVGAHCRRCGETNYHLLGYYGAVARWAKAWGVSKAEAEQRMDEKESAREYLRWEHRQP